MLCFRKILMAKNFMDKKCGGRLSNISVENFLSDSTETLVEEPFSAVFQKTAGSEKAMERRGRGTIEIFRRKIFDSNCRNIP